jgi:hypothetical protein
MHVPGAGMRFQEVKANQKYVLTRSLAIEVLKEWTLTSEQLTITRYQCCATPEGMKGNRMKCRHLVSVVDSF